MATTYIITGPPGAGKSTLSEQLALSFERGLHVNCDNIYNMVRGGYKEPWEDTDRTLSNLMFTAAKSVLEVYVPGGFIPVVDYVFSIEELISFIGHLSGRICLTIVVPDLKTNIERDKSRKLTVGEERIRHYHGYYEALREKLEPLFLAETNLTPEGSVADIKTRKGYSAADLIELLTVCSR